MKKTKLIILLLIIFLTGCYNYNELNDLAIVTALGIDKTENGYLVSIQLVNTQKTGTDTNASTSDSKFTIYEAEGNTIEEAIKNLSYTCPKRIYLNHLSILIFGEELAKDGIENILDYIARNIETRGDFYVFIAKATKANKILKVITPIETLNSGNIVSSAEQSFKDSGKVSLIKFEELLNNYLNPNLEIVIPSISLIERNSDGEKVSNIADSDPATYLKIDETIIFKKDKMIGSISNEDTLGYNIIKNTIDNTIINYKCKDGYVEALINNLKTDIKINKNNKITVDIEAAGNLSEVSCDINLEKVENHKKIEENIAKEIEKKVKIVFNNMKNNFNSDIFGFLNLYYLNEYEYFKTIEKDWYKKHFKNLKIEVNAKVNLIGKGNTLKVIK